MIGICIGTGDWKDLAKRAAEQMERMTGITCYVDVVASPGLVHPSWHKLDLLNRWGGHESLLIFDADIWCARAWDPGEYCETGLAMVTEPVHRSLAIECDLYHVPRAAYSNAGLMVVDQRAAGIFDAAKQLHPRYGSWLEQTAINHVMHAQQFPVQVMPRGLNTLVEPALDLREIRQVSATNLHFAGRKTVARLHEIYDGLENDEGQPTRRTNA